NRSAAGRMGHPGSDRLRRDAGATHHLLDLDRRGIRATRHRQPLPAMPGAVLRAARTSLLVRTVQPSLRKLRPQSRAGPRDGLVNSLVTQYLSELRCPPWE